jgi:hypothetical protein
MKIIVMILGAWMLTSASAESAAPADEGRRMALALLDKYAETQDRLRSFCYVEECITELDARATGEPYRKMTGKSRQLHRTEFRSDGARCSVRRRSWGNVKSATDFVPEDRCPYNSYLWDGQTYFGYVAAGGTPGRIEVDTRRNQQRYRQVVFQLHTPLWGRMRDARLDKILQSASALSVRPEAEELAGARCHVIEARTPDARYTVRLDPTRGHNLVKFEVHYLAHSIHYTLDRLVCKEISGAWVPFEGEIRRTQSFPNGDYTRSVEHRKLTEFTLNPDHVALRSFQPDDINDGARVQINPIVKQQFNPRDLPTWQNGRVVDKAGRIILIPSERLIEGQDMRKD